MWKLLLLLGLATVSASYEGCKLIYAYPQGDAQVEVLNKLADHKHVDLWHASAERYDFFVCQSFQDTLYPLLQQAECSFHVTQYNVSREIEEEAASLAHRSPTFDYDNFNDLKTIDKEIDRLAARCIPGYQCSVHVFGYTVEGRPLRKLIVTKAGARRKIVWVDATTHAREWLTTATIMKIMQHMWTKHSSDKEVQHLFKTYEWHFVPVVNPDGYEFSWSSPALQKRLWRKNRAVNKNPQCPGVDINRNADSAWGTEGASSDMCAASYRGPSVASEPETKALQNDFKKLGSNLLQIITMHSYGNYWLTPFGHIDPKTKRCFEAPDHLEMLRVANAAANSIEKVYNTKWKRGPICTTIYPACGAPLDYAKEKAGVKYGGVPELRGNGFIVNPDQIEPSFIEVWAGIASSMKAIEQAKP